MVCDKIIELQNASGIKAKCIVINKYKDDEDFCRFLYFALNPFLTYNLSEKTLRVRNTDLKIGYFDSFANIFECCLYLSRLRGIDNATINQVRSFLSSQDDISRDIYIRLLSKTLRLGVTAKTVNKVIDNLIPTWEVQQAYTIEKYPIKNGTEFWLTQKLNGLRATFYKGQMIARSGSKYEGLDHIVECINKNIIEPLGLWDIVLDGELTLFNEGSMSDNEAFRTAAGIINSDAECKDSIGFTVFDALYDSVQFSCLSEASDTYSQRRYLLSKIQELLSDDMPVHVLPVLYHGTDQGMIDSLLDKMVAEDKEGLMLNLDVPYKRARHRGILKIKRFYTMDLPIVRCEEGDGRLSGTLGSIVVLFDGNEVKVGSGFSDEQRNMLWSVRDDLEGTLCEVKYKEISNDKRTGMSSLQFPIFVRIRNDKLEPSYW